ncbi:MAG: pyridoxamine 5'-phosphate oxidase family protein [Pseudonocardia sp.]|nr:pyridoxamine 5'-phosphate oxidase family protein [Pseudonocardia sp.]
MSTSTPLSPTARSTLGRHAERARLDRAELYAVLDEGLICHLGVMRSGAPVVLPTCYGRLNDTLYLHGSAGASSLRAGADTPVCVTVTLLDGLVYARSVMHHSANYRSAVVHGTPRRLVDEASKLRGLKAIVEHTTPGSWEHARQPNRKELAATSVLVLDLAEASVKVRTGPPVDDDADMSVGTAWAGVLPVQTTFGSPAPCPLLAANVPIPPHIAKRLG